MTEMDFVVFVIGFWYSVSRKQMSDKLQKTSVSLARAHSQLFIAGKLLTEGKEATLLAFMLKHARFAIGLFSRFHPLSELLISMNDAWDWKELSKNCSVPWSPELIARYSNKWDWERLRWNSNLPWTDELITAFQDKWEWSNLSRNEDLPWTTELIERYQDRWDWSKLSWNSNLPWTIELMDRYQDKWDWPNLSRNKDYAYRQLCQ
jgi:hypothetical protein